MDASAPTPLLPRNPSFAGHQTFALRSGWLKKGMDALYDDSAGGSRVFARDDALVTLGVGKNMVASIRHWLLVTRMAEEQPSGPGRGLQPTQVGTAIFGTNAREGWDSYLEDEATLWLLHWQLAGLGSQAFTWAWTFSRFREYEFDRDALTQSILDGTQGRAAKIPGRETVTRDVECLLHTYVAGEHSTLVEDNLDCPLQSLGLIRPSFRRHYRFQIGPKPSLPAPLFAYALLSYWDAMQPSTPVMTLWDITYGEGSPGMAFKLDEDSVLGYLDGLQNATGGALRFEDAALTRQVVRDLTASLTPYQVLESHYHA